MERDIPLLFDETDLLPSFIVGESIAVELSEETKNPLIELPLRRKIFRSVLSSESKGFVAASAVLSVFRR